MLWLIPFLLLEVIGLAIALGPGTSPSRRLLCVALVLVVPLVGPVLALLVRSCRGGGLEPEREQRARTTPRLRPDDVRLLGDQPPMLDRLIDLLKPGGLFVADNTLWNGEVVPGYVREKKYSEEDTAAIVSFSRRLAGDARLFTSFLQVGDGVSVSVKNR